MSQALVQRACTKLRSAIADEALVSLDFTGYLPEMLDALEVIQQFMENAEMRQLRDGLALERLMCARQAAYRVIDMVDELQDTRPPAAAKMRRTLPRLAIKKNDMSTKVEEVKNRMLWLKQYWHTYICGEDGTTTIAQRLQGMDDRTTVPSLEEASVIRRGADKQRIVSVLLSAASNITQGPTSCIILPIFGLAGSGKTTLAKMVFNDTDSFIQQYNFRVWVYASPELNFHKIGDSILSQVVLGGGEKEEISDQGSNPDVVGMECIMKRLQELLNGKKVLFVVDDLWEEDSIQLQILKAMLTLGEKVDIIVTTCNQSIARKICTVEPYRLNPLDDDTCWEIIKKSICLEEEHEELEKIGLEIASKCWGLPSVARAYARMLDSRDPRKWEKVMRADVRDIFSGSYSLLSTLELSYRSIPPDLGLCFDYCCNIFPNGHNIVKDDLIRQWIAIDLIEPSEILSATEIAEGYITRLLDMSLFQTAKSDPAMLTMHDLAHDYASWIKMKFIIQCFHYMLVTNYNGKLDDQYDGDIKALRCVGCSKVEFNDGLFTSKSSLRVLELKESSVPKLPDSIWQLRHLGYLKISEFPGLVTLPESFGDLNNLLHIDLSGCSGLINLPESFGKLVRLAHVNLSGCSGLVSLPESFWKLVNLVHFNLSGCTEIAPLPESFGDFVNLSHVDLSHCHQLVEILEALQKHDKLVYLDLSFWSCFKGIDKCLGRLTNLEHLNLSNPCCYLAQHRSHLQGIKDGLCKLTSLRYLNLSMCLDPIFYNHKSQEKSLQYIQSCISSLSNLEHLDLSHNKFLVDLPQSLCDLNKLHTLDLSGCIRLKRIAKRIGEISSLKLIVLNNCPGLESCQFVVHDRPYNNSSNLVQLEVVDCKELEISCLEKVKYMEEAQRIKLVEKQSIKTLKLCWSIDASQGSAEVEANDLLGELVPPHSLQCLELHGYSGEVCLPAWRIPSVSSHLPNLVEVIMEDFPRCTILPPLSLLPNLKRLVLRRMGSITRIDDRDRRGSNQEAFSRLSKVTIDEMEKLEVFLFPRVSELVIRRCPELSFGPHPPRAQRLVISDSNNAMSSWVRRQRHSDSGSSSSTPVTELMVENCNLPLGDSSLLHHLPGLRSLAFKRCDDLITSSTGIIQALSSLQSLCFSHCEGMISLPEYLGDITSLRELTIQSCYGMKSLLQSADKITNLEDLYILDCPELKKWCELEENKAYLAHIRPKYKKLGASTTA